MNLPGSYAIGWDALGAVAAGLAGPHRCGSGRWTSMRAWTPGFSSALATYSSLRSARSRLGSVAVRYQGEFAYVVDRRYYHRNALS